MSKNQLNVSKSRKSRNVEIVSIDKLKPNKWNPNEVSEENLKKLRKSIKRHGILMPILVLPDYTIIDGEHRWICATKLGWKKVPVIVLECSKLEARELTINLNYLRGEADWDKYCSVVGYFNNKGWTPEKIESVLPLSIVDVDEMLAEVNVNLREIEKKLERDLERQRKTLVEDKLYNLTLGPFSASEFQFIKTRLKQKGKTESETLLLLLKE